MVSLTAVPVFDEAKSTSSTSVRIRGMPRPRSKLSRSGSVTGGCSGSDVGAKPSPRSSLLPGGGSSPSCRRTVTWSSTDTAPCASMAFVQASETASFRSSMRSSARTRRVDATEDTTKRTSATNSGRAGMSSSRTCSTWSATSDGGVDRVVDGEDLGETGDLEHLQDAVLRAHQREVAVVAAESLQAADQHAEPGGVEEVDAFEVDDDLVLALTDQLDELLAEPGRRVDVDL